MLKFFTLIVAAVCVAVPFGFLSAAAMATDLGLVASAAFAALIALSVAFHGAQLLET